MNFQHGFAGSEDALTGRSKRIPTTFIPRETVGLPAERKVGPRPPRATWHGGCRRILTGTEEAARHGVGGCRSPPSEVTSMETLNLDLRLMRIQAQWTEADRAARQVEGQRRMRDFLNKFLRTESSDSCDVVVRGQRFDMHPR